jgi:hypothetical protein
MTSIRNKKNTYNTLSRINEKNLYEEVTFPLPPNNLVLFPSLMDVSKTLKSKNETLHNIIGTYAKNKIDNDKLYSNSDNKCKLHLTTMLKRDYYWRILYMLQYYQTKNPDLTLDTLVPDLKLGDLLRDDERAEEKRLFPLVEESHYTQYYSNKGGKSRKTKRHFLKNKKKGRRSRRM